MKRLLLFVLIPGFVFADGDGFRVVSWPTPPSAVSVASVTAVSVGNSGTVTLVAARSGRLKVTLFNEKETLYIKAGPGASITDYTWRIPGSTSLEILAYNGPLTAILGVVGPTIVHVTDF